MTGRVLVLGGAGMLGHKLGQVFEQHFETWVTVRSLHPAWPQTGLSPAERTLVGVDASYGDSVGHAITTVRPDVVVNAIGIVKQSPTALDPVATVTINALLPHQVAAACRSVDARLVHVSTDCVFAGRSGMYRESDVADAEDLYGRSKLLGEVATAPDLTIRTSIIGRELSGARGLLEWFLSTSGRSIDGFTDAIFSGLPTIVLARLLVDVIAREPPLSGLYHVSSDPISKHDLLCLLKSAYGLAVEIEPVSRVCIDRSLDSRRFRSETGFVPPSWETMIDTMRHDPSPYEDWRRILAS